MRDGIGFYACHFDEDRHALEFYTDFDDLLIEEVRLLASIALAVGREDGLRSIYPDPALIVTPDLLPLDTSEGVDAAWRLVADYLDSHPRRTLADPPLPERSESEVGTKLHTELHQLIFRRIEVRNHALLRGLATWIKAGMLWMHRSFAEEAGYALFVSLDASFAVVRDILRANGNTHPSAYDAAHFIETAFGEEPTGYRYFEEFYEDRIRSLHPESRLGTFVYAPISVSELYQLACALREVWRFLIVGQVIEPPRV